MKRLKKITGAQLPDDLIILPVVRCPAVETCFDAVKTVLHKDCGLSKDISSAVLNSLKHRSDVGYDLVANSVAIVCDRLSDPAPDTQILVRLDRTQCTCGSAMQDDDPIRFVWILLSHHETHPRIDTAAEFVHLMEKPAFREAVLAAERPEDLRLTYNRFVEQEIRFKFDDQPELGRTGRLWGGVKEDIQRRLRCYASDFSDGLKIKTISSSFFLFFACFAATVAFGGLTDILTKGQIGTVETIVAGAVGGIIYAMAAGQPLTLVGATGPIVVFIGILWSLCQRLSIPFAPTYALVGLWTMLFLLVIAATDLSDLIRYFTRFTDDIFAGLISVIFIVEAVRDIAQGFYAYDAHSGAPLLQLLLAVGTYGIAKKLSKMRRSPYLRRVVREFLSDFGPTIAIVLMCVAAAAYGQMDLKTLPVPEHFATTSGREWFINPLGAPSWVWFAAAIPALLLTILVYLDQNITSRIVNHPAHRLKKGAAYHLDLTVVAVMTGAFSLFGLPWVVAATVRSLNHVHSLATYKKGADGRERIGSVLETRLSGLLIHLLIGVSTAFLAAAHYVPMSVLFGLFLFMGITSLSGNAFFERLRLWFVEPGRYPPIHFLRAVPTRTVHAFTAIQLVALVSLWLIKASSAGIVFPLFIALLVPVRMILAKYFKPEHLALLDAAEEVEDEESREVGP